MSEQQDTVNERAAALKLAALATHGYLGADGEFLDQKVEDVIFDLVSKAEVNKLSERKTTAIRRTALTRAVFPHMPGPGDFSGTPDPEASEMAWSKVNEDVWRMCDTNAGGRIQSRLNGEHALVLCRTSATGEKGVWGVYVTRDWKCILTDWIVPDQKKVARAIQQQAANGELGASRLPEHGKKFKRELSVSTKHVLQAGTDQISRQIESGSDDEDA